MTVSDDAHEWRTLVDVLRWRAEHQPSACAYRFLLDGEEKEETLTYAELEKRVLGLSTVLQGICKEGDRALLVCPPGLDFIASFLACLYAGVVAVPIYYARNKSRLESGMERIHAIVTDCNPSTAIGSEDTRLADAQLVGIPLISAESARITQDGEDLSWRPPGIDGNSLAFLQYTSGSTGRPRGVMVAHKNILSNARLTQMRFEHTDHSHMVSWLPPYHDMGLIGGILQPLFVGFPATLMSPVSFLQRPIRWLKAVSRFRGTTSGGPNIAFELCANKINGAELEGLDLSCWSVAFCGAEPVRAPTVRRFCQAFAKFGFREEAFYPCYGLAEATLLVAGGRAGRRPVIKRFRANRLALRRAEPTAEMQDSTELVSCGSTLDYQRIAIVDESNRECAPGQIGEIWVSGPGVASGYWGNEELSASTFRARTSDVDEPCYLRTGDLGCVSSGELFITGRLKDLITLRGVNYYPDDLERAVDASHRAIRPGCTAALGVDNGNGEGVAVVAEIDRHHYHAWLRNPGESEATTVLEGETDNTPSDSPVSHYKADSPREVIAAIRRAIAKSHRIFVGRVVLIRPGTLTKTSSGKIPHSTIREQLQGDSLHAVADSAEQGESGSKGRDVGLEQIVKNDTVLWPTANAANNGDPKVQSATAADDTIEWLRGYLEERVNYRLIDERRCIPPYVVLDLGNKGILGMQVPTRHGGLSLRTTDMVRVMQQIASADLSLALFVGLNNILGVHPIQKFAPDKLREDLLPVLATGRELAAFALTEPGAGSNPRKIAAIGRATEYKAWELIGTKIWSGSASWAGVVNVFVRLFDSENTYKGITAFAIRQGTRGMSMGPEALTMGMRGMVQNAVLLRGAQVRECDLLGSIGAGMDVAQDAMMLARLGIGAMCVGAMMRCTQLMLRYSARRDVSTGRLADNPFALSRFDESTSAIFAVKSLVRLTAELIDSGQDAPAEALIACKNAGAELLWQLIDGASQLVGGRGYMEPNVLPRMLRDARVLRVFEGPTETLNSFLGSRVWNAWHSIHHFLAEICKAQAIARTLNTFLEDCREHCKALKARTVLERTTHSAHLLLGEAATYAILAGAVIHEIHCHGESAEALRSRDWACARLEQLTSRGVREMSRCAALPSAEFFFEVGDSYRTLVGDMEEIAAGEDTEIDSLLKRDSTPDKILETAGLATNRTVPHGATQTASSRARADSSTPSLQEIENWLVDRIAREGGISQTDVELDAPFEACGIDSVTAATLSEELGSWLKRELDPTLLWDFPTIAQLARYLGDTADPERSESEPESSIEHRGNGRFNSRGQNAGT